jgi:hypothetical protein
VTDLERAVTTMCMAAGATYYAYLVGSIARLPLSINPKP